MDIEKKVFCWSELQIGDFFLDVGANRFNFGIKIGDNTYFNLETNRMYRHLTTHHEMPRYFKCDYEVW